MLSSNILPFVGSAMLGVAAATSSHQAEALMNTKRGLMTCEETYGAGWIRCGDDASTFCFNPSEGQACCPTDFGYCNKGTQCAPVAGFCCPEGEALDSCANNAGFTLPPGLGTASVTLIGPSATGGAGASGAGKETTAAPTATTAPTGTSTSPNNSATGTSVVQVSVAIKEQWTLTMTTLAMAVVGVFMASC